MKMREKVLIAAITILVLIAFASLPKIFHSGWKKALSH